MDPAQAALRARQGTGARYDASDAPADDLLLARRGNAFFARLLTGLPDADLGEPGMGDIPRHQIIAQISQQARAQALALKTLRAPLSEDDRRSQVDLERAMTLPPHALRYLFQHASIHLDVEWRDLREGDWQRSVEWNGATVPANALPLRHARALWRGALALNCGARESDIPAALRP